MTTALRKKAKAKTSKAKAKKATASSAPKHFDAAVSHDDRRLGTLIKGIDIASLQNAEINAILLHCASALNLRKVVDNPTATMAESTASYCYTKSGSNSTVSIWSGGFKVGESSEADAKSSGIPPCGG